MAGRGPRTTGGRPTAPYSSDRPAHGTGSAPHDDRPTATPARPAHPAPHDPTTSLVRIHDLAGRPRGTGFLADHHGTVVTSHEAVDGLSRLVLYDADDHGCVVTADAVTPLPELDLALVRTEGLAGDPLPVTARDHVETGTYVRLAAGCWREARVLAETPVTYTATGGRHLLDGALELAIGTAGRDALRCGGGAAGGPVLDAATGAVVAVLGTALHSGRDAGFAVPLRPGPPDGPLAELLARNAATVPAYGADLDPAGVLELTATPAGPAGPPGDSCGVPVERAVPAREFAAFAASLAAVPHHRVGPVVQALLLVARQQGTRQLAERLGELADALEAEPDSWWAARLLAGTLLRVPDATPYLGVLRLLADRIVEWASRPDRPAEFAPGFWTALPLPTETRLDLLRRLVLADAAPHAAGEPRHLDAVAGLLAADPTAVQPLLTRWFDDERPLPAMPHATVATAAQALLHTHRHRAPDDLTEVLADCAHPRADELLGVLAEEEPSALCRAVDRWAHDERPARRAAAVTYGLRAAPHVRTAADRELLRYAALTLLARPADRTLHGGALALLVRDPQTRSRHLRQALERFAAGDPQLPPSALLAALTTHPEPVLDAFRARLRGPDAGGVLRALVDVTPPALARRVVVLVREAVEGCPETAGDLAGYVDRRLDQGPAARAVLFPLVTGLLDGGPVPVRAALAAVLAAPGTPDCRPLRRELLEFLLTHEDDPAVLAAVLHAAARRSGDDLRDLVHRTGLLLVRTPQGAARFDRGLVDLGRHVPGFAAQVAGWLTDRPGEWAAVVGPSARRVIESLAGVRVPA
ncbi:trypsin-like peptidase domain-containing protein [Streptomyces sp. NEAU-NA10]|uniref:trypsin-like peptidase domain-containing protein n=1 Tax=Streptomyces sp. NEAU-NA10 TaxID=3416050 RepID=UPI003CC5C1A6